jgi:hypothetical protein
MLWCFLDCYLSLFACNKRVLSLFPQGCVDTSPSGNHIRRACLCVPWFHLTNLYTVGYGVPVCVIMSPIPGELLSRHWKATVCGVIVMGSIVKNSIKDANFAWDCVSRGFCYGVVPVRLGRVLFALGAILVSVHEFSYDYIMAMLSNVICLSWTMTIDINMGLSWFFSSSFFEVPAAPISVCNNWHTHGDSASLFF